MILDEIAARVSGDMVNGLFVLAVGAGWDTPGRGDAVR